MEWDYSKPDLAVAGTILHSIKWLFVRIAPVALIGSIVSIILTRKKIIGTEEYEHNAMFSNLIGIFRIAIA